MYSCVFRRSIWNIFLGTGGIYCISLKYEKCETNLSPENGFKKIHNQNCLSKLFFSFFITHVTLPRYIHEVCLLVGGCKGIARDAPGSNFFNFHAVLGKIWPNNMLAPPSRVIDHCSLRSWHKNPFHFFFQILFNTRNSNTKDFLKLFSRPINLKFENVLYINLNNVQKMSICLAGNFQ